MSGKVYFNKVEQWLTKIQEANATEELLDYKQYLFELKSGFTGYKDPQTGKAVF